MLMHNRVKCSIVFSAPQGIRVLVFRVALRWDTQTNVFLLVMFGHP